MIKLSKGSHTISCGDVPEKFLEHSIKSLKFNGVSLEGYKTRSANKRNYYWWGRFNCSKSAKYILNCSLPKAGEDIRVYVDDNEVDPTGKDLFTLDEGVHFIQISSDYEIDNIDIRKL